jgi:DNA-binding MarR family transcriptional regulator
MGIVERKPHPTDGRQVYIALTTKGAAVRKSAKDARRAWLMQAVLDLDERERETLFKAGDIIQKIAAGRIAEGRIAQGRIANGRLAETRLVEK